jgi:hypothetical protein
MGKQYQAEMQEKVAEKSCATAAVSSWHEVNISVRE